MSTTPDKSVEQMLRGIDLDLLDRQLQTLNRLAGATERTSAEEREHVDGVYNLLVELYHALSDKPE